MTQAHDTHRAGAVRRRIHRPAFVAGGNHYEHAGRGHLIDDIRGSLIACTRAAKTDIDDFRRVRIGRYASHRKSRRPENAGEHVRVEATALAQHTHRQDVPIPVDACDADAIVRERANDSRHTRAVPRTVGNRRAAAVVGSAHPVAGIGRIRIAAIAIVRGGEDTG